jgi:hypothetical protein
VSAEDEVPSYTFPPGAWSSFVREHAYLVGAFNFGTAMPKLGVIDRLRPPLSLSYAHHTKRWVILLDTQRLTTMDWAMIPALFDLRRSRFWRAEARSGSDALGLIRMFLDTHIFIGHPA